MRAGACPCFRFAMTVSFFKGLILSAMGGLCAALPLRGETPVAVGRSVEKVVVIPVRDAIDDPTLFVLRRGLKHAIDEGAKTVVLDMNTPGGSAETALEMMAALEKFEGTTITYVNSEALSAGAFIAASTDEIRFAPGGVIGAAAAVTSTGEDIPETMRLKLNSYLRARVRATSEGKGLRGEVVSAMIDKDFELKIGEKILKPKGELLSLTATEASATYGDPPEPLLAAGIHEDLEALLKARFGETAYTVERLELTWSEELAEWLVKLSPIFLGLGLLAIYVEFKTPGFGVFGIAGALLLAVVFLSNSVAGLSGHEPLLVFAIGFALLMLELTLMPGVVVMALSGVILMLGSLLWSMADIWPNEPINFSGELLVGPLQNLGMALVVAVGLAFALVRYLPRGWFWQQLALGGAVAGAAQRVGGAPEREAEADSLIGRIGVAATSLFPSGQVEVDGRRYEARLEVGFAEKGTMVTVTRTTDFGLMVEVKKS